MSGGLPSLRLAARLARRETRHRPWRTLLVALLVAVPVAGMVVGAVLVRTEHRTPEEQWREQWGRADLVVHGVDPIDGGPAAEADLDELLPTGSRQVTFREEWGRLLRTTDGRRASADVTDVPLADPVAAPIAHLTDGRAPERPGEVLLTRALAERLDAGVGEVLRLQRPEPATWRVVGIGEVRWWGSSTAVVAPGTAFAWRPTSADAAGGPVLVDLPPDVGADDLAPLAALGQRASPAPDLALPADSPLRTDVWVDDPSGAVAWSWVIGALVLTVAGIVIAAAFAAGARRQLATLGQLAANGAPPATLRRVLFLQGTWTGVVGVVLGLALGAAALAGIRPWVSDFLGTAVEAYVLRPLDLVPVALLGVAAATVAAMVPARTTAAVPVLAALAGRRPLRPVPPSLPLLGGVAVAGGLGLLALAVLGGNGAERRAEVWTLTAVLGGVAVLLGACAVAPAYVSVLEPLARRLRGHDRLAARSLARQRTRTAAVVSAVCAACALAIGSSALIGSSAAGATGYEPTSRPDEVQVRAVEAEVGERGELTGDTRPAPLPDGLVDDLRLELPVAEVSTLAAAAPPGGVAGEWRVEGFVPDDPRDDGVVLTPSVGGASEASFSGAPTASDLVATVVDDTFGRLYTLPDPVRAALDEHGAVALSSSPAGTATVALAQTRVDERGLPTSAGDLLGPVEVRVLPRGDVQLGMLPQLLVTGAWAAEAGLEPVPGPTVVRAEEPLTVDEQLAAHDVLQEHAHEGDPSDGTVRQLTFDVPYTTTEVDPWVFEAALAGVALVVCLFVVAVSLGLAAVETRDERDVLVVVGAPPATLRRASGRKALLLTGLGAVLAVPVGFLPVWVFAGVSEPALPLVFPWLVVALLVVAVPLVAAGVTTLGSGLALRFRPVRVSTMALD